MTDVAWANASAPERALHVARAYDHVREVGRNSGRLVEWFLRHVRLGRGYPWCAAYVYTCCIEAGMDPAKLPQARKAAAVINWRIWAAEEGYRRTRPERGYLFYWVTKRGTGHIGFVAEVLADGSFRTIEGNTNRAGSREGDGVYDRRRTISELQRASRGGTWGFIDLGGLN